jgi:serine/threonine-protein kinase
VDGRLPSAPELLDDSSGFNAPAYMSPEQILGEPPDPRSDLFSLGVVLYEILSGEHPFVAPDDQTRTQRIRHAVPVALGRQPGKVPVSLERIVHRCLEKLPSDRFYSAEELCVQLRSALDGLGVASPREAIGKLLPGSVPAQATIFDLESSSNSYEPLGDRSLAPALAGLFVACTLIVVGGAVIYFQASRTTERGSRSGARLEFAPPEAAYLRVVAEPWANVIVDGQLVATTPVGQPIPLSPGVHYIKFEHPQAPTEQRTLRLSAGESVLLDVKMKVPRPTQMELESVLSDTAADAGDAGDASNAKPSP